MLLLPPFILFFTLSCICTFYPATPHLLRLSQALESLSVNLWGLCTVVQSLRVVKNVFVNLSIFGKGNAPQFNEGERVRELIGETFPKNLSKYFPKLKIVETKLMTFYFARLAFGELQRFSLVLISRSGLLWNNSRPLRQVEIASNCEKNILSRSNILQTSSYCLNFI